MTLNDYAYRLWNLLKPRLTDDENIDLRDIKDWIVSQRALFLRNEFNKRRNIDDSLMQSLGCVELILASPSECPCGPGCTVLRTKLKIPTPIQMHNDTALVRVGYPDFTRQGFPIIKSLDEFSIVGNSRFNKSQIYAIRHNDFIYLKIASPSQAALSYIGVRGVWEDPREVSRFTEFTGECGEGEGKPCYNDAITPFPMNQWFTDYIEGAILQYKAGVALQATTDPINDGEAIETLVQGINQRQQANRGQRQEG